MKASANSVATPSASGAASGRYIRCSDTVWLTSGTTLELGARMAKNHAAQKPGMEFRQRA